MYRFLSTALDVLQTWTDSLRESEPSQPETEPAASPAPDLFTQGQAPAHWLEYIASRAPHLLEPGAPVVRLPDQPPPSASRTPFNPVSVPPREQPKSTPSQPRMPDAPLISPSKAPAPILHETRRASRAPAPAAVSKRQAAQPGHLSQIIQESASSRLSRPAQPPETRPAPTGQQQHPRETQAQLQVPAAVPARPQPSPAVEMPPTPPQLPPDQPPDSAPETAPLAWFEHQPGPVLPDPVQPEPDRKSVPTIQENRPTPQVHQETPNPPQPAQPPGWIEFQRPARRSAHTPHNKEDSQAQQPPSQMLAALPHDTNSPSRVPASPGSTRAVSPQQPHLQTPRQPLPPHPWPDLPATIEPDEPRSDWEVEMRDWAHLQKLDREQKGTVWSESPF